MYDYVLQYGFDKNTQKTIQEIKGCLKRNKIEDRERNWLSHITIDLYNCKSQNEFIEQIAKQKFEPFVARIKYLWVYNCDMELIKEYELKS